MPDEKTVRDVLVRLEGLSVEEHLAAERQAIAALERLIYAQPAGVQRSRAERPEYAGFVDLLMDLQDSHLDLRDRLAASSTRLNVATAA